MLFVEHDTYVACTKISLINQKVPHLVVCEMVCTSCRMGTNRLIIITTMHMRTGKHVQHMSLSEQKQA